MFFFAALVGAVVFVEEASSQTRAFDLASEAFVELPRNLLGESGQISLLQAVSIGDTSVNENDPLLDVPIPNRVGVIDTAVEDGTQQVVLMRGDHVATNRCR